MANVQEPVSSIAEAGSRFLMRLAMLAALTIAIALLIVAVGGHPVPVVLALAVVGLWMLREPLVAVVPMIVAQIIWLVGNYALGGLALLSLSKVSLLCALTAWMVWAVREQIALTYAPHMTPMAGFFLVVALAPVITPAFDDSLIGIGKYAMMMFAYLIVANVTVNRRAVLVVALTVSATATMSAALALIERFMPGVSLQFDGVGLGAHLDTASLSSGVAIMRVTGGIGDANWFSYTMVTALPLCLFWFRAYSNLWVRSAAVAMALVQMSGIVLSYTRTPLIGLGGAVVFLLWKRMLPLLPMSLLVGAALVSSPAWLPDGFIDRFTSEKYLREGSTPMRSEIFSMALDLIRERPLLGYGYQQFGEQFIQRSNTDMGWEWERRNESGEEPAYLLRAHNIYLDVWVQHGVVGLALLVSVYALLFRELAEVSRFAHPPDADLAICLMACLFAFLLCGIGGHSQELKIFWVLAGLAAGLRRVVMSGYRVNSGLATTAVAAHG